MTKTSKIYLHCDKDYAYDKGVQLGLIGGSLRELFPSL